MCVFTNANTLVMYSLTSATGSNNLPERLSVGVRGEESPQVLWGNWLYASSKSFCISGHKTVRLFYSRGRGLRVEFFFTLEQLLVMVGICRIDDRFTIRRVSIHTKPEKTQINSLGESLSSFCYSSRYRAVEYKRGVIIVSSLRAAQLRKFQGYHITNCSPKRQSQDRYRTHRFTTAYHPGTHY